MILKLDYSDITNTGVRGTVDGKQINFFMLVGVDENTVSKAYQELHDVKAVVGFHYVGDPEKLKDVEVKEKPIIVKKAVDKVDINLDFIINAVSKDIRIVFTLPETYSDMRAVHDFSQKYDNVRFEGGKFLRLDGCNVGELTESDIPKKVHANRIPLVTDVYSSIMKTLHIDDVDDIEFFEAKQQSKKKKTSDKKETPKKAKSVSNKKSKPKKKLSSLVALTSTDSLDNF